MIEKIMSMIREPGIGGKMLSVLRNGCTFAVVRFRKRVCGYTTLAEVESLEDAVNYIQNALDEDESLGMTFNEKWIAA
jgi:hypothetical protein